MRGVLKFLLPIARAILGFFVGSLVAGAAFVLGGVLLFDVRPRPTSLDAHQMLSTIVFLSGGVLQFALPVYLIMLLLVRNRRRLRTLALQFGWIPFAITSWFLLIDSGPPRGGLFGYQSLRTLGQIAITAFVFNLVFWLVAGLGKSSTEEVGKA